MWYNFIGAYPMTQSDPYKIITQSSPTAIQEERAKSIRRFNWLYVYTPIAFLSLVALAIIALLLYLVVNPISVETYATISGIADAVVIMGILPLLIIFGALLLAIFSIWIRARRRGFAVVRGSQKFFWRVQWALDDVQRITRQTGDMLASPFISIRAVAAYVRSLFHQLIRLLKRGN